MTHKAKDLTLKNDCFLLYITGKRTWYSWVVVIENDISKNIMAHFIKCLL